MTGHKLGTSQNLEYFAVVSAAFAAAFAGLQSYEARQARLDFQESIQDARAIEACANVVAASYAYGREVDRLRIQYQEGVFNDANGLLSQVHRVQDGFRELEKALFTHRLLGSEAVEVEFQQLDNTIRAGFGNINFTDENLTEMDRFTSSVGEKLGAFSTSCRKIMSDKSG